MPDHYDKLSDEELNLLVAQRLQQQKPDLDKLSDEELDQLVLEKLTAQKPQGPTKQAAVTGLAQSLTFGSVPAIEAATEPVIQKAIEFGAGLFGATPGDVDQKLKEQGFNVQHKELDYSQRKARSQEGIEKLKQKEPAAFFGGEVIGALSPAGGPAKLFGAVNKAVKSLPLLGKATGLLPSVVRGTVTAGMGTAGLQAAEIATGARKEFDDGQIDTSAFIGGALPVAGAVLRAAPKLPAKILALFGGVPEKTVKRYVVNAERINKAPTKEKVIEEIEKVAYKIKEDLNKKITKKEQLQALIKDLKTSVNENLRDSNIDLRAKLSEVETRLNNSFANKVEKLKVISSLSEIGDDVFNSISKLKDRVIGGSAAARDILEEASGSLSKSKINGLISNEIKKLKVGKVAIGQSKKDAIKKLQVLQDDIDSLPNKIPLKDVKKILQSLDEDITFALNNNQFSAAFDGAAARVRGGIDRALKLKSPKYATAMKKVADDTKVLSKANKYFTDPDKARTSLKTVLSPNKVDQKETLINIGKKTGVDFEGALVKAEKAKKTIGTKEGLRKLREKLPEMEEAKTFRGALSAQKRSSFKKDVLDKAVGKKEQELKNLVSEINEQKSKFQPLKRVTGTEGSTPSVQSFISSEGRRNKGLLKKISELSNKDFSTVLKDIGTKEAFTKDATRGSRNVNLWAIIGAVTGTGTAGPIGAGVGALVGSIADKFGPQLSKKILDQSIKLKLPVTLDKISKLDLPDNAKEYLVNQFMIQKNIINRDR